MPITVHSPSGTVRKDLKSLIQCVFRYIFRFSLLYRKAIPGRQNQVARSFLGTQSPLLPSSSWSSFQKSPLTGVERDFGRHPRDPLSVRLRTMPNFDQNMVYFPLTRTKAQRGGSKEGRWPQISLFLFEPGSGRRQAVPR